jgi:hypothetical protein
VYRTSRSFTGKCPHRRTTKSGGRKPPVVTINANATAIRTPSAVRRTIALVSAQTCFPHPRRADARRSCECAYVHRECRYFSADSPPGAAGVSQPWHDVLSPGTAIICNCVTEPRRADARRSCRTSVRVSHKSQFRRQMSAPQNHQERGA